MKEHEQIKIDMDHARSGSYERNRLCLEDYEFAIVEGAMWKGNYAQQFKNKPKPEINQIFGSINRLLGHKARLEMNAKIISDSDQATDEDAEMLQGLWRNDFQAGQGSEAVDNADKEAFFSGFGAIKLVAVHDDEESPDDDHQNLMLKPVMSAASSVIFGASIQRDKADAKQCWEVFRTSRDEVEEEYGVSISSINSQIHWFDWDTDTQKDIYLAHYYEVVEKKIVTYNFDGYEITVDGGATDSEGNEISKSDLAYLKKNADYETTTRKVKVVEYALLAGDQFLVKAQKTPFKRVPIIPQYGYYSVINGIEYYCGEVRKRRDPQMFLNTYFSSLMEIMSAPQVEKPEYTPEQINRHAGSRAKANIDNAAFVMSDPIKNADGSIYHAGPIGKQSPPQIGTGLAAAGQQLQTTLLDMSGTGQSTVPSNAAADAIKQVNERQDDSFQPLMQGSMAAIKAACEVWLHAAQKLYFSNPRKRRAQAQDGTHSQLETMQYGTDSEGNYGPYVNAARGRYSVQVKIGETHKSKREAELETTLKMLNFADTNTPQGQLLLNQAILSTTGEGGSRSRKVANYQIIDNMLALGLDPEPKTDEEKEYVQQKMQQMQAEAQNQQDPQAMLAQAEGEARRNEGLAALQNEQNDADKIIVDQYNAETARMKVIQDANLAQIKAAEIGVKIQNTQVSTVGKDIDNRLKLRGAVG